MGVSGGTSGKEPACQSRRHKRLRFNLWSGRTPGEGHGNPFQYSCLENPMDRGAWWATVYRVAKSQTRLKLLSTHTHRRAIANTFIPPSAMFFLIPAT